MKSLIQPGRLLVVSDCISWGECCMRMIRRACIFILYTSSAWTEDEKCRPCINCSILKRWRSSTLRLRKNTYEFTRPKPASRTWHHGTNYFVWCFAFWNCVFMSAIFKVCTRRINNETSNRYCCICVIKILLQLFSFPSAFYHLVGDLFTFTGNQVYGELFQQDKS